MQLIHPSMLQSATRIIAKKSFNPLNPELNPICYLLALLAHHFLHVSRIRVNAYARNEYENLLEDSSIELAMPLSIRKSPV